MSDPFLKVASSLSGRRWSGPDAGTLRAAEALVQAGHPDALARVLARQGIDAAGAPAHLAPKLRDLMPDPRRMKDCQTAAARLSAAVEAGERIAIFADYDVDGGASAALLIWWLRALGREATLYVPDRITEGYGPNAAAMARLAEAHDLILCVDCGTMAGDALAAGSDADIVVIDHHLAPAVLPDVQAVVNPNRQDEDGSLGALCAAAVTFLVLVEANRQRREAGLTAPDLTAMLDLVGLATVADVATLSGVNRAFVRAGLRIMAQRARPGLAALAERAGLDRPPEPYHLGYVLGPRINAGGRIGRSDLGARLLATADPHEAAALAERLEGVNRDRRALEASIRAMAEEQVEARGTEGALIWAAAPGWHPGVLGIVAGHLARRHARPAVVMGIDGGLAKGSGRSVAGIDLGRAIHRLLDEGLIEGGGGHEMAAGIAIAEDRLTAVMARLSDLLARQGAGVGGPRALRFDGLLMPGAADVALCEALASAGPYGQGAPAPRFAFPDMAILDAREVGTGHLKLRVGDGASGTLDAIAFGAMAGPLGALAAHGGARFHLAGGIEVNHWNGRQSVQLRLDDAAPA